MTIAVDCRMLDSSGVGAYIRGILPLLLKSPHFFLLLGDSERLASYTGNKTGIEITDCKTKIFSLAELFFFPKKILKKINSADVFFTPFFNIPGGIKVRVYAAIHDIIFPDMPELVSFFGLRLRMWFYKRAAKKAKKIFTVSEFSKSRIEYYLGTAKPVIVTHSAIQNVFLEYRGKTKNAVKSEALVFIGNIKKHKGLDCLLEALLLARTDGLPHRLFIIGSRDNFRTSDNGILRKIDSLGPDVVSFTGFVSDMQLMEYVSRSALLVQPSLYEGFGLPPLEAMVLGTRALVSDIPVFKEIYAGFPVVFFRAGDAGDLKNKLMELLYHRESERLALPPELVYRYTFGKTASMILRELE